MERRNITYNPGRYIVSPYVSLVLESTFLSFPSPLASQQIHRPHCFGEGIVFFPPLSLVYLTGIIAGNSHRPCHWPQIGRGRLRIRNAETEFQNTKRLLLGLLLLSCFSHVRLCATPETAAHQAPLSLGFSRQEHWSGLPFPSPMHESEK